MLLTNSDEHVIRDTILTTFDKCFFVEAGAGAGKTTLIANRIVNQLKSGKFIPERIVAITFTNEATRSLKNKISDVLDEALSGQLTDEERNNLERARDDLDLMQISTIHGLCMRILTEKGFDIGLPIGFKLLEPEKEGEAFDSFFSKWVEKNIHYSDWNMMYILSQKKDYAVSRIKTLAKELYSLPSDTVVKHARVLSYEEIDNKIEVYINNFITKINEVIKEIPFDNPDTNIDNIAEDYLRKYGKDLQLILMSKNNNDIFYKLAFGPSTTSYILNIGNKDPYVTKYVEINNSSLKKKAKEEKTKEIVDGIKDKECALRQYVLLEGSIIKEYIWQIYVKFAMDAAEAYRSDFPSTLITNDKLLEKTKDLLASSDEIRDYFASKFDCIYVDEFQDTDHIQDEFIHMLAGKPGNTGELRDGALFVVGDPKQSIYRFRGAEPNVYFSTKEYMIPLANAYVCNLSYNFRSDKSIIDWVNNAFASKNITGDSLKYPYVPMTQDPCLTKSSIPEDDDIIKGVYCFASPESYKKDTTAGTDAENVCKLIDGLVGKVDIDDGGRRRKIKYSDFLLLCCNTYHMDEYADVMEEYGIPYTMIAKVNASDNYYLNAFVRMYDFLVSPYDRVSICGAIETLSLSGVDDAEKILDELREDTKHLSGYGLLRYLIKHVDLIMKKDKEIDELETMDLQRKLHQMTEKVLASDYVDKKGILKAIRDYVARKIEKELILNENEGRVRFMDLHQAKGLEGNIVIWTNRYENRNYSEGGYRDGNNYYPDIKDPKPYGKPSVVWAASSSDAKISKKAMDDEESEKIRLEYVGATRAKQALIFMDISGSDTKGGALFNSGYSLTTIKSAESFAKGNKPSVSSNSSEAYIPEDAESRRKVKESAKAHSGDLYVSKTPSELEIRNSGKGEKDSETESDRVRGNIVGLSIHRAFELLIERSAKASGTYVLPSDKITDMCITQALNENSDMISDGEYGKYRKFLSDAVSAFKAWFEQQAIFKKADVFYTELPFFYMTDKIGNGEKKDIPYWMHGESDLVIKLKDGSYHVIDYKSDDDTKFKGEAGFIKYLNDKYTPQIVEYKNAISSIFGVDESKVSASLISFSYMNEKDWKSGDTLRVRETAI